MSTETAISPIAYAGAYAYAFPTAEATTSSAVVETGATFTPDETTNVAQNFML